MRSSPGSPKPSARCAARWTSRAPVDPPSARRPHYRALRRTPRGGVMTGGLLDFFVLEATEYVDQLDALASRATIAPPEPVPFARAARGLRGAATMAKLGGIAEVATGLERLIRQLRDGNLRWNAG